MGWWDAIKGHAQSVVTFSYNTGLHLLQAGFALRTAVPTLVHNPKAKKIVTSMGQVLQHDILPLVSLHALTTQIDELINNQKEQELPYSLVVPTMMLCSSLMLQEYNAKQRPIAAKNTSVLGTILVQEMLPYMTIHLVANQVDRYLEPHSTEEQNARVLQFIYSAIRLMSSSGVSAYQFKKIGLATVRDLVTNTFAPAAFNSHKRITPHSACIEYQCNTQRIVKGMGRELFILALNDVLIFGISYVPGVGSPLAFVLTLLNNGRFVVRSVTPERCDRHKYMEQEFVLAIGLLYELLNWVMLEVLTKLAGPIPSLYVRILQHMLLQMHVNLAAHMDVPLVKPKDATLIDVFDYYELITRFALDVLWAGLLREIPKALQSDPNKSLLISFSANDVVSFLKSDLERLTKQTNPVMQIIEGLIRDPVIADYWDDIQKGGRNVFESIARYERSALLSTLNWRAEVASPVSQLLDYTFGFPAKLTLILLMLSKQEDFWNIIRESRAWFERHGPTPLGDLAPRNTVVLALGGDVLIPPPITSADEPFTPEQLFTDRPDSKTSVRMSPAQLMPTPKKTSTAEAPDRFFYAVKKVKDDWGDDVVQRLSVSQ